MHTILEILKVEEGTGSPGETRMYRSATPQGKGYGVGPVTMADCEGP
jgi:hypothetical protein